MDQATAKADEHPLESPEVNNFYHYRRHRLLSKTVHLLKSYFFFSSTIICAIASPVQQMIADRTP